MNEKLDLCKTNAELCKENTTMKHTTADLNDKVKSAEEEKASLITAIKLLYKEKEGNEDQINVSQVEQIYSDESLGQQHSTRDQVISNISTIEIIDIECVLLSFLSQKFVSTKWRIQKGIFTRFRLLWQGISRGCGE